MLINNYIRLIFFVSIITVLFSNCKQTSPSPEQKDMFLKYYGDAYTNDAVDMIQKDNLVYLLMNHTNGDDKRWVMLYCVDSYGNVNWKKNYRASSSQYNYWAHGIIALSDNNFAIIGTEEIDQDTLFTDVKLTVINPASDGKVMFDSVYNGSLYDEGFCFAELTGGNYLILGTKSDEERSNVLKYRWVLNSDYDIVLATSDGAMNYEAIGKIEIDEVGSMFLPGNIIEQGNNVATIQKLNSDGIGHDFFPIANKFGGAYNEVSVVEYPKMLACGFKETGPNGGNDAYIAMIDFDTKTTDWKFDFGGAGQDDGVSAIYTADENVILAGKQYRDGNSDIFVLQLNSMGTPVDTLYFGADDNEQSVRVLPNMDNPKGFMVFGTSVRDGYSFSMLVKSRF